MRLSVIIVNYNVKFFLEQALLSVRRASQSLEVEVFVVDNNSADGSVDMVRNKFPEVKLIANKHNPGFSIANNQAIRQAKGQYILLLNPDTVVAEDTFRICLQFMDDHPQVGGLGVRMIDGSGQFLPESKRGFPSPWVAFCKAFGLSRLFPRSKWFNHYHLGYLSEKEAHPIEVLAGAFMWMRKSVLDEVGLLDETFFMYGEDIDLSYRIVKGGYQNYYLPETTIIHYKGESTKKGSLNYVRVFYQAMIIFARKHFQGAGANFFVAFLNLAIYFRASLTLLSHWARRLRFPILDAGFLFLGLFLLKNFWANYHFRDPNYYSDTILYINFPLYILIWILSIFFSGGYDQPPNIRRIIRGILVGAILAAAVYGFLPMDLRSSRALILLATAWALFILPALRLFGNAIKYGNFALSPIQEQHLAIIGLAPERERARTLLNAIGVRKNDLGDISIQDDEKGEQLIGHYQSLADWVRLYRLDELLFCSRDISYHSIIHWMDRLGPGLFYKILPEHSDTIIGSHSKNSSGELYTLDIQFQIARPAERRNKRLLDLILSLGLILSWPILGFWQHSALAMLKNAFQVLLGRRTWVGYPNDPGQKLPPLRPAVLHPVDRSPDTTTDQNTQDRLAYFYARDYRIQHDLDIIWHAWRKLGG